MQERRDIKDIVLDQRVITPTVITRRYFMKYVAKFTIFFQHSNGNKSMHFLKNVKELIKRKRL